MLCHLHSKTDLPLSIQCPAGEEIDIKKATYGKNVCPNDDVNRLTEVKDM